MAKYYYSTQPFLAWCLNHYFYGGIHFAYLGSPFYPYRRLNPRSSSPLRIYEDLYEPWKDSDRFSKVIIGTRFAVINGVHVNAARLQPGIELRLNDICEKLDPIFFYPIVYRVDIDTITTSRLITANSGLLGSNEYRIDDLRETEFDVLFADLSTENLSASFHDLWSGMLSEDDVLDLLEKELV